MHATFILIRLENHDVFLKRCGCGNYKSMPNEKGVRCITLSSSFQANRLDIDIVEISFYEYKEIHGPPREDEEIHEEALCKLIDVASRIANKCYYFRTC